MQLVATATPSNPSPDQVLLVGKGVRVDGIQYITPGLRVEVHITGEGVVSKSSITFNTFSKMKKFLIFLRWKFACSMGVFYFEPKINHCGDDHT